MKTSRQLKDKARNLANAMGIPAHIVQRNYFLERFLERISLSEYRENFILKGGVLITSMLGIDARSTLDLDTTLRAQELSITQIEKIIGAVLTIPIDDGVTFSLSDVKETRLEGDYPGCCVMLNATLDKTRDTVKLDITQGDVVTPRPIEYDYRLMFEERDIKVLAYNLETVLAEKFVATLSFDIINTRMKDFYDIYAIVSGRGGKVDPPTFAQALNNTAKQRQLIPLLGKASEIIETLAKSDETAKFWVQYQSKYSYAAGVKFSDTIGALKTLAKWSKL